MNSLACMITLHQLPMLHAMPSKADWVPMLQSPTVNLSTCQRVTRRRSKLSSILWGRIPGSRAGVLCCTSHSRTRAQPCTPTAAAAGTGRLATLAVHSHPLPGCCGVGQQVVVLECRAGSSSGQQGIGSASLRDSSHKPQVFS